MNDEKQVLVSKNVIRIDDEYWHYFIRVSKKKPTITGKYLFFSESKEELEKIAIEELENGGFFHAKINTDKHKKGKEFVLCLYYSDDSRKFELADKYKGNQKINIGFGKVMKIRSKVSILKSF
jgi:hypothetical protein